MSLRRSRLRTSRPLLVAVLAPALLAAGLPALATPATAATPTVVLTPASRDFLKGETVFVQGTATSGGAPARGLEVTVRARSAGGSWRTVDVVRTNRAGRFHVADFPRATTRYVAKVGGESLDGVTVQRASGSRTLAERRRALAPFTGPATSAVHQTRRYGERVTFQKFRRGWLVQVASRTSFIRGTLLTQWRRRDAIRSRLGAPVVDSRCGLMEGGCIERFQNGSLYLNKHARHPVTAAYGSTPASPILAVALSQKGYNEPYYRGAKYLKWQGVKTAWCGIFLSWASWASGSGNAIPRHDDFPQMVAAMRSRARKGPRVGQVAFIGGPGHISHSALVVAVRKDGRIVTIEGNMDAHAGNGFPRGVHSFVRRRGAVVFYAAPKV